MAPRLPTSTPLNLWIKSATPFSKNCGIWELDSLEFDDGSRIGTADTLVFEGVAAIIKHGSKVLNRVEVGRGHSTQNGFFYMLKPSKAELLLDPPFLLSGDVDIEEVFSGLIRLEPSDEYAEHVRALQGGESVPVCSGGWYGVATKLNPDDVLFEITVFGYSFTELPSHSQTVIQLDISAPIGKIGSVGKGSSLKQ